MFYLNAENFLDMFTYCYKIDSTKDSNDFDNYRNSFLGTKLFDKVGELPAVMCVGKLSPIDETENEYKFNNLVGSESWSIPQAVGMFALARQVDKDITFEEFYEIV